MTIFLHPGLLAKSLKLLHIDIFHVQSVSEIPCPAMSNFIITIYKNGYAHNTRYLFYLTLFEMETSVNTFDVYEI